MIITTDSDSVHLVRGQEYVSLTEHQGSLCRQRRDPALDPAQGKPTHSKAWEEMLASWIDGPTWPREKMSEAA